MNIKHIIYRIFACLSIVSIGIFPLSLYSSTPKLIVVISYDQLRGDRLSFYSEELSENGFKRVMREGITYTNALFDHATTTTASGHSVLLTGVYPHKSGITANDFYLYDNLTKRRYCVEDDTFKISPRSLLVPTLGDILKKKSANSKVIGIALKDRAAVLMAGKSADYALWLDEEKNGWNTSAYYLQSKTLSTLPQWLQQWNTNNKATDFAGSIWQPIVTTPTQASLLAERREFLEKLRTGSLPQGTPPVPPRLTPLQVVTLLDSVSWEGKFPEGSTAFPHKLPSTISPAYWEAFALSPYSVEYLFSVAKTCIEKEELGNDRFPDILCLSVSTTDIVGHLFGPDSREMKEIILSCDKELGSFVSYLDSKVGRDNYTLVITGDHGITSIPEYAQTQGIEAGRISKDDVIDSVEAGFPTLLQMIDNIEVIDIKSNKDASKKEDKPKKIRNVVQHFEVPSLYIRKELFANSQMKKDDILRTVCQRAMLVKGIGIAIATDDIVANKQPNSIDSTTFALLRASCYPNRMGDVLIFPKEHWIFGKKIATHGSPVRNDRWVPLMFMGNGITANISNNSHTSIARIAPTLAELLGVTLPNADGEPLPLK